MNEMVFTGRKIWWRSHWLTGKTTIQAYEETSDCRGGCDRTGAPVSVTLAPGILSSIDGIERPLNEIAKTSGHYISRGVSVERAWTWIRKWETHMTVKKGDRWFPVYRRGSGRPEPLPQGHGSAGWR